MGKNKQEYLPLVWLRKLGDLMYQLFGDDLDPHELRLLLNEGISVETRERLLKKYPKFIDLLNYTNPDVISVMGKEEARMDHIRDLDCITLMLAWSKNKQVYKMDKDFIDDLIETDNVRLTKNMFDYLPYKILYIDISDNEKLCENIGGKGLFIEVTKLSKEWSQKITKTKEYKDMWQNSPNVGTINKDKWCIHICKIDESLYYNDIFFFPNEEEILDLSIYDNCTFTVPIIIDKNKAYRKTFNEKLYKTLILQALIYLSSTKPDIKENEHTKETYREPSPLLKRPKNKFSEIRQWDIGVRYGNAFRKFQKEHNARSTSTTYHTGTKKRPHSVRAHWHYYWYGKKDSPDRVKRPLWVESYFTGLDSTDNQNIPVTIHKTE